MHTQPNAVSRTKILLIVLGFVILLTIIIAGGAWWWFTKTLQKFNVSTDDLSVLLQDASVLKQNDDHTNILLLGVGGADHEGGNLTDTMQILSMNTKTNDTLLISLPRDLWIPSLRDRINTAYVYGEERAANGGGFDLSKTAVTEITGIPIQYSVLIDFSGFEQIIDLVGGVDVDVTESFTDTEFPIKGRENDLCDGDPEFRCRFETVTFSKGIEHMNGKRALTYVRSRHADGESGTDFSRGARQQAVLRALRSKVTQTATLTNIDQLVQIKNAVFKMIQTDLSTKEQLAVAKLFLGSKTDFRTTALAEDDPSKNMVGLLMNPPPYQYDGKWVLVPKSGDFTQIQTFLKCKMENKTTCDDLLK